MPDQRIQKIDISVEKKRGLSVTTGAKYPRLFDRRILDLARGNMFLLWGVIFFGLLIGLSYVAQAYVIALILNSVYSGKPFGSIIMFVGLAVVILATRWIVIWGHDQIAATTTMKIATALRRRLFTRIVHLGPGWASGQKTGELQATLIDGVEAIEGYFGNFIPQVVVSMITGIAVVVLLFNVDPVIGLIMGTVIVIGMIKPLVIWRGMSIRMRIWRIAAPRLFAEYLDNLQGMFTLKSFNASRRHGERLREKTDDLHYAEFTLMTNELYWQTPFLLVSALGSVIAIVIGTIRMDAGAMTVGGLVFVLMLVREANRPVNELRQSLHYSIQGMGAAELVLDVLEASPTVSELLVPVAASPIARTIEFEHVTFKYRNQNRLALDDVSFSVREGEKVGIVGRSGAGKTTITTLLFRFLDPQQGTIRVGGRDIRELSLDQLRSLYSVVSQDTYLFHGTVRENLLLAKPDATLPEIEAAARAAAAHDYISSLPNGYDTIIGERGVKLSGGERQRLAIARAILKDAPMLILDEATSSVDVANEARIQEALASISRGRTTVIIAHRLSTVRNADRIFVLDHGRLVETGPHSELITTCSAYRSLVYAEEQL